MADRNLITPSMLTGAELREQKNYYWDHMRRTREQAAVERKFLAGNDMAPMPENFKLAGADHFRASIPHAITVPQRVRQKVIKRRPYLSVPLGPKGLGITAQRLTTKVEQPLNAICEDARAGVDWETLADTLLFEGFVAQTTVVDPASWKKRPSAWVDPAGDDDPDKREWKKRYRVDGQGRFEDEDGYDGEVDTTRAGRMYGADEETFRARNVPVRHRALSIQDCAPIFGDDPHEPEGLIVVKQYSLGQLKRRYRFGEEGLATLTGSNEQSGGQGTDGGNRSQPGKLIEVIEGWFYDEDRIPYVSYAICGPHGTIETRWKTDDRYDGALAVINLKDKFGLDRLPVDWGWGLSWSDRNPDMRALGFTRAFRPSWKTVNAMLTGMATATWWTGYPTLIEELDPNTPEAEIEGEATPEPTEIGPMMLLRTKGKIKQLEFKSVDPAVLKAIDILLGANAEEAPGKSNRDQSGFSQSMAEAFEELAMTTVHQTLGRLYASHGSYVLEAGKRLPEKRKAETGGVSPGYAPIMVFRSTDVPTRDDPGDARHEPMVLDPDMIDETFTAVPKYQAEMSIPERQQSAEMVERRLKTRRAHLEADGDPSPETTELELQAEDIRSTDQYKAVILEEAQKILGREDLKKISDGQNAGLANETGLAAGANQGVAPAMPPGVMPPPVQGAMGVPDGGQLTGMGGPTSAQAALAGTVAGGTMQGPVNNVVAAGGVLPPNLPTPGNM